jgi:surface-anchored protein
MKHMTKSLGILAALSIAGSAAAFDHILSVGHADIGVGYAGGVWDLHVHDDFDEYEPEDTLLRALPGSLAIRPNGSQWDFLGVGAGAPIWVLPQTLDPNLLYLGIAAEEVGSGIFDNDQVFWNLKSVSGPGHFAIWQNGGFGNPIVKMASADGITPGDQFLVPAGGHQHANFGFTALGLYQVGLSVGGYIGGQWVESDTAFYNFEAVPEPATLAALGLGAATLLRRRARR